MNSALLLLVYALTIIASAWQLVGIWRSASNHFLRGGTRFWAGVAKVMVVLGALSTAGLIWRTYIPQSIEFLSIISGDARMGSYEIRVLPGGTEIEFRGGDVLHFLDDALAHVPPGFENLIEHRLTLSHRKPP